MSSIPGTNPETTKALPTANEMYHRMRDVGTRLAASARGLYTWNLINLSFVVFVLILPLTLGVLVSTLRYMMFNALLLVVMAWWRLRVPLRINLPIVFVILLQLWFTFCSYLAHHQLGRTNDFETSNYFLVMVMIFYFQANIFVYYWPKMRTLIPNMLLVVFGISALVAWLQFVKFGPALYISAVYNTFQRIDAWGGAGGVRAIGLASWPEWMAFQAMVGWAILAARLMFRPLKGWEFTLAAAFLLTGFMAQSRIMYVSVLACTGVFLYLLIRMDRSKGPLYLTIFAVTVLAVFAFASDQLSYVLQTDIFNDPTLQYRKETGWVQAYQIYDERPWTGIGPDNDIAWEVKQAIPDRWTQGQYLDNGFLLLLVWGGIPALAIFLSMIGGLLGSTYKVVRNKTYAPERRQVAFIVFVAGFCILNNMVLNNGFTNVYNNCMIALLGGTLMPTAEEETAEIKNKLAGSMARLRERVRSRGASA